MKTITIVIDNTFIEELLLELGERLNLEVEKPITTIVSILSQN